MGRREATTNVYRQDKQTLMWSADTPPRTPRAKAAGKEQERKRKEQQQNWGAADWHAGKRWKGMPDHCSKSASAWSSIDHNASASTPTAVPEPPPPLPSDRSTRPDDGESKTESQQFQADALKPYWAHQWPAPSTTEEGDNKQAASPAHSDKWTRSEKDGAQRRKLIACIELLRKLIARC